MSNKPDYIHPSLLAMLPIYKLVADCYEGEQAVKGFVSHGYQSVNNGGGDSTNFAVSPYLPDPSPNSEKPEYRKKRYHDYVTRAVFYNVTKRTVNAMSGAVFAKYPTMTLNELQVLEADADGAGKSLTQMAREALTNCLKKARGLLLADMPINTGGITKANMAAQGVRPIIVHYESDSIINWRYRKVGGVLKQSLIVLSESYVTDDDGYEQKTARQLLVLRLNDDNKAESEVFRKDKGGEWISQGINAMTDHNGKQLDDIPAYPYGAVNNDLCPDDVPMSDIASVNIAHFRNSADLEESLFIAQPTLVLSGLTEQWVSDVLENGVAIGSRSGILLPVGGNAQLLQPNANDKLQVAMSHKEQMMVSLGAKLVEQGGGANITATQANNEQAEETSVLSSIANNVSDAFSKCIKACARYMGYDDKDLGFVLNTDFGFSKMTPQQRAQLMAEYQGGLITFSEARDKLVESEVANIENYEEAAQVIASEQGALFATDRAE